MLVIVDYMLVSGPCTLLVHTSDCLIARLEADALGKSSFHNRILKPIHMLPERSFPKVCRGDVFRSYSCFLQTY